MGKHAMNLTLHYWLFCHLVTTLPRFKTNINVLFEKGRIFTTEGTYVKHLCDTLGQKGIILILRSKPMHIGGRGCISADMKERLLARPGINRNSVFLVQVQWCSTMPLKPSHWQVYQLGVPGKPDHWCGVSIIWGDDATFPSYRSSHVKETPQDPAWPFALHQQCCSEVPVHRLEHWCCTRLNSITSSVQFTPHWNKNHMADDRSKDNLKGLLCTFRIWQEWRWRPFSLWPKPWWRRKAKARSRPGNVLWFENAKCWDLMMPLKPPEVCCPDCLHSTSRLQALRGCFSVLLLDS